jgi:hypothetical protein
MIDIITASSHGVEQYRSRSGVTLDQLLEHMRRRDVPERQIETIQEVAVAFSNLFYKGGICAGGKIIIDDGSMFKGHIAKVFELCPLTDHFTFSVLNSLGSMQFDYKAQGFPGKILPVLISPDFHQRIGYFGLRFFAYGYQRPSIIHHWIELPPAIYGFWPQLISVVKKQVSPLIVAPDSLVRICMSDFFKKYGQKLTRVPDTIMYYADIRKALS